MDQTSRSWRFLHDGDDDGFPLVDADSFEPVFERGPVIRFDDQFDYKKILCPEKKKQLLWNIWRARLNVYKSTEIVGERERGREGIVYLK